MLALLSLATAAAWQVLRQRWHGGLARRRLVRLVDKALPQTQCGQCGYPGCLPYARALAAGAAAADRCPPGGAQTGERLARLLPGPPLPLNAEHGRQLPPQLARIDETLCIGCTKCIAACPTDAIIGATGQMHSVIAGQCTGCDLCLAPCPVDCIEMVAAPASHPAHRDRLGPAAALARRHFAARNLRLQKRAEQREARRPDLAGLLSRTEARRQQGPEQHSLHRGRRAAHKQRLAVLDKRLAQGGDARAMARWQAERRNLQYLLNKR